VRRMQHWMRRRREIALGRWEEGDCRDHPCSACFDVAATEQAPKPVIFTSRHHCHAYRRQKSITARFHRHSDTPSWPLIDCNAVRVYEHILDFLATAHNLRQTKVPISFMHLCSVLYLMLISKKPYFGVSAFPILLLTAY